MGIHARGARHYPELHAYLVNCLVAVVQRVTAEILAYKDILDIIKVRGLRKTHRDSLHEWYAVFIRHKYIAVKPH